MSSYARTTHIIAVVLFLIGLALPSAEYGGFDAVEAIETGSAVFGLIMMFFSIRWGAAVATALIVANIIEAVYGTFTGDFEWTLFNTELFILVCGMAAASWALWIGEERKVEVTR